MNEPTVRPAPAIVAAMVAAGGALLGLAPVPAPASPAAAPDARRPIERADAAASAVAPAHGGEGAAAGGEASMVVEPGPASAAEQAMAAELDLLASAWSKAGGRFGYPYWEKAWQRWIDREIDASTLREYAVGYHAQLVDGCGGVAGSDVGDGIPDQVLELLDDACELRMDALLAQRRELDVAIERDSDVSPAARRELHRTFTESLDESYRNTRLAMNISQAALREAGLAQLDEDAFV